MRSIFGKILLWFFSMFVLAIVSFVAVSILVAPRRENIRFTSMLVLQLDGARTAFERGGQAALETYLTRLQSSFPGRYYLTDGTGRDLATGEDHSALVRASGEARPSLVPGRDFVLSVTADDGRYRFIAVPRLPPDLLTPLPYFAWIPLAIGILCYVLAVHLASPARRLRDVVDRFGHGDLSVRAGSTRKDEFGDLARAFDLMAGRIERLVAEQQRLLQDVSHELRSPLARLGYAIELARVGEHREEALTQIQKDTDRLAILVNELLDVTRGDGEPMARLEDVSLGALAAEIAADCHMELKARSCSTALVTGGTIVVKAVPRLIRRAVENVLRNAVRHAPAGSAIDITVARTAAWSTIAIRDRGPGVPEDQLEKIFQPFFRVQDDRDRETGGMGLGLAIAQRAIAQHGGRIRARNVDPGLEILIELPA